ncbi:hypothetical protein [Coleofasciculus chthonoplastes]|uniref:hypothetical protein n=1 Tax=Coleofasciculus chthonoplastes TaxID=64178 RepID=UPI003302A93E
MLTTTEDSIRSLSTLLSNKSDNLVNGLATAKLALEQLSESGTEQLSREEIRDDLIKLVETSEHIKSTDNLAEKTKFLFSEYKPLSKHLRTKYSDLFPSRVVNKLEAEDKYMEGFKELLITQDYMLQAFSDQNPVDKAEKLYTGMVNLSNVLEQYISFFTDQLIENIKTIALEFLADPTLQPEQPGLSTEVANYLTAIKHTSRGLLWQLENYQKHKKNTVGELLNWLDSAPTWKGDDLDECLEYVNITRK